MSKLNYRKIIVTALLIILPLLLEQINSYFVHIAIAIGIFSILSLSLNVIIGYAGQFALGHAAFYGIGAYSAALLMIHFQLSFWLALPAAAIIAGLFGFLLGLPVIRLRGDYLAIVTLGFGEIVRLIFVNWVEVTRGPMGIPGIPAPRLFGYSFTDKTDYYYLILVMLMITIYVIHRVVHSGIGLNLLTIREDETLAKSIGIRPVKYKLLAFTLGGFFCRRGRRVLGLVYYLYQPGYIPLPGFGEYFGYGYSGRRCKHSRIDSGCGHSGAGAGAASLCR